MMFVIFRILFVDLKFILRDIHKLCSQEHITDPSYFADRAERHRKKNTPWSSRRQADVTHGMILRRRECEHRGRYSASSNPELPKVPVPHARPAQTLL